ncbi:hypothetical protein Y032_0078g1188 [Ancylostoma ceylanicum]|uniref:Mannosyltransferase n=1 Tax=Ancylostoma ceylanicum TaxID=53326 RepID=A0A016TSW7_9BILA|nr:hypothetical protein Y032_0078g1188 [Ancylostoma ceylanicum]
MKTFSSTAVTIPIDSLLWGRPIYPEFEVAIFNILQNRSHEYGVSPFLWYFYSCLPRGLMASLPLAILGLFLDRRLRPIVLPAVVFILLYSFLPHKELRFIMYAFPLINLSAAVFCARMLLFLLASLALPIYDNIFTPCQSFYFCQNSCFSQPHALWIWSCATTGCRLSTLFRTVGAGCKRFSIC